MSCYGCQHADAPPCDRCRLKTAADETLAAFPVRVAKGGWIVDPFELTPDQVQFAKLRSMMSYTHGETYDLEAGRYVRLVNSSKPLGSRIVMSTTPMELRTNRIAVAHAKGDVLIGGLGLGVVARAIRGCPAVKSLTIVELSPDVIALVAPTLPAGIDVVRGDIASWAPRDRLARYDFVWLDIWPDVPNSDAWVEMKALRRRWRKWAPAAGAIRCWREDTAKARS